MRRGSAVHDQADSPSLDCNCRTPSNRWRRLRIAGGGRCELLIHRVRLAHYRRLQQAERRPAKRKKLLKKGRHRVAVMISEVQPSLARRGVIHGIFS
jgi:hypothetical protein